MNKFCFGAIYNGRLWEKELRVSAHEVIDKHEVIMHIFPEMISKSQVMSHGLAVASMVFTSIRDQKYYVS